jgi:hypothetical protein
MCVGALGRSWLNITLRAEPTNGRELLSTSVTSSCRPTMCPGTPCALSAEGRSPLEASSVAMEGVQEHVRTRAHATVALPWHLAGLRVAPVLSNRTGR